MATHIGIELPTCSIGYTWVSGLVPSISIGIRIILICAKRNLNPIGQSIAIPVVRGSRISLTGIDGTVIIRIFALSRISRIGSAEQITVTIEIPITIRIDRKCVDYSIAVRIAVILITSILITPITICVGKQGACMPCINLVSIGKAVAICIRIESISISVAIHINTNCFPAIISIIQAISVRVSDFRLRLRRSHIGIQIGILTNSIK